MCLDRLVGELLTLATFVTVTCRREFPRLDPGDKELPGELSPLFLPLGTLTFLSLSEQLVYVVDLYREIQVKEMPG